MDFNLGSQALHDIPDEEYYWQAVGDKIVAGTHEDKFTAVMKDALKSILGYMPDVYDEDPGFSAARGAAEFARRGGFL
jgi:hypothetical protein